MRMTKEKIDEVREAANYGAASYNVDNDDSSKLTSDETNRIIEAILNDSPDKSFLYSLVKELKKGEKQHGKNRK